MSPEQLLGELETLEATVVCDLEAGLGTLTRLQPGQADVATVVVEPTAKSIEVGRRAAEAAGGKVASIVVVANRVSGEEELAAVRERFPEREVLCVPYDSAITRADVDGRAPIDAAPASSGVRAIVHLADALMRRS